MPPLSDPVTARLLVRLRQVQVGLGYEPAALDGNVRFADAVDSMGLAEFLALVADDCRVSAERIELAASRRFTTVADLADALRAAGLAPDADASPAPTEASRSEEALPLAWLASVTAGLPKARQSAADLDVLLGRPAGWLQRHAGIHSRRLWQGEDPVEVAARTARECLERAGLTTAEVRALLVTSEAPPLLAGLFVSAQVEDDASARPPPPWHSVCGFFLRWAAAASAPAEEDHDGRLATTCDGRTGQRTSRGTGNRPAAPGPVRRRQDRSLRGGRPRRDAQARAAAHGPELAEVLLPGHQGPHPQRWLHRHRGDRLAAGNALAGR